MNATTCTCGHGYWAHLGPNHECSVIVRTSRNQYGLHQKRCACASYTPKEGQR